MLIIFIACANPLTTPKTVQLVLELQVKIYIEACIHGSYDGTCHCDSGWAGPSCSFRTSTTSPIIL